MKLALSIIVLLLLYPVALTIKDIISRAQRGELPTIWELLARIKNRHR